MKGVPLTVCSVFDPRYCNSINKHHLCETICYIALVNMLKEAYRIGSAN